MDMDREDTHPPPVRCSTGDHHSGFDYIAILMSRGCNHHRRNEGRRPGATVHEPARAVLTTDVLNGATRGSPHASEPTRSTAPWRSIWRRYTSSSGRKKVSRPRLAGAVSARESAYALRARLNADAGADELTISHSPRSSLVHGGAPPPEGHMGRRHGANLRLIALCLKK